jgi:hypothetical protein
MFTKESVAEDFTCPKCGISILPEWQESAPDEMGLNVRKATKPEKQSASSGRSYGASAFSALLPFCPARLTLFLKRNDVEGKAPHSKFGCCHPVRSRAVFPSPRNLEDSRRDHRTYPVASRLVE